MVKVLHLPCGASLCGIGTFPRAFRGLALDLKLDVERAIAAAKAVGMTDPSYEAIARRYIDRAKN